jgi:regulator of protease activity HflC (stomatin/prohibitin superfamily)
MKKILYLFLFCSIITACHSVAPNAEEEAVLIEKPLIWGHGGIDKTPVITGLTWCWWTTKSQIFKITPQRYDEQFDDIFSNDNTPLDFDTYINIQIQKGKTPILLKNYGTNWYKNNIQVYYRNKTREYVSMYNPFDLISNREVLNKIDSALMRDVTAYVAKLSKDKEFPITILSITTGAAKPNHDQLEEMNKTAQYIQQKRSMEQKAVAEEARAEAERKRAEADKAYMTSMNLTPAQFINLKWIETVAAKNDANIDVLVGGGETPMWNIKR